MRNCEGLVANLIFASRYNLWKEVENELVCVEFNKRCDGNVGIE